MHQIKRIKFLLTVAVAAMAMTAVLASAAAAEIVPAKFSSANFKLTTTGITVKADGIEPKTCTPSPSTVQGYAEGANYLLWNVGGYSETKFSCGTSSFTMAFLGAAQYDTVANRYILHVNDFTGWSLQSPWGGYWQKTGGVGSSGTWVNGSGSTASTVTFSNQFVGSTFTGKKITVEGSLKVTTSAGGLVTLSH